MLQIAGATILSPFRLENPAMDAIAHLLGFTERSLIAKLHGLRMDRSCNVTREQHTGNSAGSKDHGGFRCLGNLGHFTFLVLVSVSDLEGRHVFT